MHTGPSRPDTELEDDPLLGLVLHNSYRIVRKIGDGGMGAVYEAAHVRLTKKRFAIKLLSNALLDQPEVYARFRREAEIATELGHQNIVEVMDFNELPSGQPYMVMEFLSGVDLGSRLRDGGRLQLDQVVSLMAQVGGALQAVHERGIVHRDMKPENIFLIAPPDSMRVKVLDFGISKIRNSKTIVTQHNMVFGTPYYMSPEQAEGAVTDIDHTTDIFALGAICYQAISGAMPFDAPTIPGVLYRVCHTEPDPITDVMTGLPERLNDVLQRAMAKKKQDRYQAVMAFVEDVNSVLQTVGAGAVTPTSTAAAPSVPSQPPATAAPTPTTLSQAAGEEIELQVPGPRRGALIGAVVAGLLVLVGGAAVLLSGGKPSDPPATTPATAPPIVKSQPAAKPEPKKPVTPPEAKPKPPIPAADERVNVQLALEPANAKVSVDGKPSIDNPLRLLKRSRSYELRVEARGFKPLVRQITADTDKRIALELTRKAAPKRKQTRPTPRPRKTKQKLRFDTL